MRRKHVKKLISILISATCIATTTGCSSLVSEDVASYPLTASLTQAEVVDYYAEALKYDSIVSRNVDVHKTTYETMDIEGEKADKLKELTQKCEAILGQDSYELTEESSKLVSADTFGYIKGIIDNEALTNSTVKNITGALGYYFVDVQYDISKKTEGSFNNNTNLIGLNGAFYQSYDDSYHLDTSYMKVIANKLNEYYLENNILLHASFNGEDTLTIGDNIKTNENTTNTLIDNSDLVDESSFDNAMIDDSTTDSNDQILDSDGNVLTGSITDEGDGSYTIVTPDSRRVQLDVSTINKVVGSSLRQKAIMPELETVYTIPTKEGDISGYGIYIAGGNGLKTFGFDRSKLAGTITLRYVFKDDSEGTGEIHGVNIYCTEEEVTNGINTTENNVLIPEFLQNEFEKLIERADRVQVNYDLAGLMSGNIYEDMGFGVLRGYRESNTNIQKYMSTIRQVIARDTTNNSYLLEVETTTIEGAKDVDRYGTYKDKAYVVIQQQNNKFVITDWIRTSRTMTSEPAINPDSNVEKRLVALNLAGEISDDNKDAIKSLLSDLYTACSNRILHGPYETEYNGETITIEKGMYDCFSSDVLILSSDELEYENSALRNILVKHGVDVNARHKGTVTEWIGGYENQAEFTTEELVLYNGKGTGYYMQVYYLATYENDNWVIAERTVLDGYEITDSEKLENIKSRVGLE